MTGNRHLEEILNTIVQGADIFVTGESSGGEQHISGLIRGLSTEEYEKGKTEFLHIGLLGSSGPFRQVSGWEQKHPRLRKVPNLYEQYKDTHIKIYSWIPLTDLERRAIVASIAAREDEGYGIWKLLTYAGDARINKRLSQICQRAINLVILRRLDFTKKYHCAQVAAQELEDYLVLEDGTHIIGNPLIHAPDSLADLFDEMVKIGLMKVVLELKP